MRIQNRFNLKFVTGEIELNSSFCLTIFRQIFKQIKFLGFEFLQIKYQTISLSQISTKSNMKSNTLMSLRRFPKTNIWPNIDQKN